MKKVEARAIINVFLKRIEKTPTGVFRLDGVITDDEIDAIRLALRLIDSSELTDEEPLPPSGPANVAADPVESEPDIHASLNLSIIDEPDPPENTRLCIDFGTAMSKATLVSNDDDDEAEDIVVLRLGQPGDNEVVSENMLVSSVYIDNDGLIWFGQSAVERSKIEITDGRRQRLDNIKRRLSEDGLNELVTVRFNPTEISITYGDMILAYLTFLTWVINQCLTENGFPRNLNRRYAMPCLPRDKGFEVAKLMGQMLGQAQVLADTFSGQVAAGLPLSEFLAAASSLRRRKLDYKFIMEELTEPLGVAGSFVSWNKRMNVLAMIIDIGAGTSDLSLFRFNIDPTTGTSVAFEVTGSARGLTEAGNHLDKLLIGLLLRKAGVTSENSMWTNIYGALELEIRNLKETLFNEGSVLVTLMNGTEVEVELDEFLGLDQVKHFGDSLKNEMQDILQKANPDWTNWATGGASRYLGVILTGGGATLPMVRKLANEPLEAHRKKVPVQQAKEFPDWIREIDENLVSDYPRMAVSIGGARKHLITLGGDASVTTDVTSPPIIKGYYQKGPSDLPES